MRSPADSYEFIDESTFALAHLTGALTERLAAFHELGTELAKIEKAEELVARVFVDRDQWSPDANYHYVMFMKRMSALAEQRASVGASAVTRSDELLTRLGATEESMGILAGAILQIGKQVLSFRFGRKPRLEGARLIGTQSALELIWEGRNHALHWEEDKGWSEPPSTSVQMLLKLADETQAEVTLRSNNALVVLAALGWSESAWIAEDLRTLVSLDVTQPT